MDERMESINDEIRSLVALKLQTCLSLTFVELTKLIQTWIFRKINIKTEENHLVGQKRAICFEKCLLKIS